VPDFYAGLKAINRRLRCDFFESVVKAVKDPGPRPDNGAERDAQLLGDGVRRLEPYPMDILRQGVGVGPDGFDRGLAVGFVDADGAARADAIGMQEDHDFPDDLLLCSRRLDFQPPLLADAGHLFEAGGKLLDDREDPLVEFLDQLFRIDRADPLDEPAA